ncbi:MAG: hypothetical protein WEA77_09240 [Hyphomonas sp.]
MLTYEDGAMLICPECGHEWAETRRRARFTSATRSVVRSRTVTR